jgi:exodeoxyribonuclease-3
MRIATWNVNSLRVRLPQDLAWRDHRMFAFRRNHGLRIDLVLASEALAARCTACHIDREPRRAERPSDHTPLIAQFELSREDISG